MSKIDFEVERSDIYAAYVYLLNRQLDILKKRLAIYSSKGPLICSDFTDIYYDTPKYIVVGDMYKKEMFLPTFKDQADTYLIVADSVKLSRFLGLIGFGYTLNNQNFISLKENNFNGKFHFENCEDFGYRREEYIWKNGMKVPNHLSDYDINKYKLVKRTELTEYFSLLAEIDPNNPNAIFEPFPEEGQIRARILE